MENIKNTENKAIEEKLGNSGWQEAIRKIALPGQIKKELIKVSAEYEQKPAYKLWYAKAIPAFCIVLILATTGITARAAYINTHIRVFLEKDVTQEDLGRIEAELLQLAGIYSCRYVNADTAWREYGEVYLTPELIEEFKENPFAESANFVIGVSFRADMDEIKTDIESVDGVRRISGLWEE